MDIDKVKREINSKYPNIEIVSLSDKGSGKYDMDLRVGAKELAYLENNGRISPLIPRIGGNEAAVASMKNASNAGIEITRRTALSRGDLDLAEKSILTSDPHDLFQRSIQYYYEEDIYGSVIRALSNFSSSGFENDIDDVGIKSFFDSWGLDIGMDKLVEDIFFDLFRVGMVRTYKVVGKYSPKINTLPPLPKSLLNKKTSKAVQEQAAKKIKWSKDFLPIKYTILNPLMIEITGSMLFDQTFVTLKSEALSDLKALLEKDASALTEHQRAIVSSVPAEMKKAAQAGDPYTLNPYLVGEVDYRRMPYERYPRPRGVNAFESIDYKRELRKADYSTLDGITNYILKITVGNDEYPVTNQEVLENVAELFNTPAKSFNVVWNHTLEIKKIVSPEIENILGQDKYAQVNDDYTGALGVVRALIDGVGTTNSAAAELAVKSVISEVNYARRQVRRWIHREYRDVAQAMGFKKYPTVRFNDMVLKDEVEMMRIIQGLIDRRILSYETGVKRLNHDWPTEKKRLSEEKEFVLSGDFGIIGSPYNPKATPPMSNEDNVQPEQKSPKGTPSEGRPPGDQKPVEASLAVNSLKGMLSRLSGAERLLLLEFLDSTVNTSGDT